MTGAALKPGEIQKLDTAPGLPELVHVFGEDEIRAYEAALHAGRALLLRGEPGTGKTQFAKALAAKLKRAFVAQVIDSRTEARDLLWHYDAVRRLAEAQVQGVLMSLSMSAADGATAPARKALQAALSRRLNPAHFTQPRVLWWGLDWVDAKRQAAASGVAPPGLLDGCSPENGVVVLIDEIDKAGSEVPNGLLETLGAGEFGVPVLGRSVTAASGPPPALIVITTNDTRGLPDAFVRRCVVLNLALPDERPALEALLIERGHAHFGATDEIKALLEAAAAQLIDDREAAVRNAWYPKPGQAEYMDLVRAALSIGRQRSTDPVKELERIRPFILRKHAPDPR
jgi:MoxR-like ATPase